MTLLTKTRKLLGPYTIGHYAITIEFCLKDIWIGIYWEDEHYEAYGVIDYYVCLIPCLAFHLRYMAPKELEFSRKCADLRRDKVD